MKYIQPDSNSIFIQLDIGILCRCPPPSKFHVLELIWVLLEKKGNESYSTYRFLNRLSPTFFSSFISSRGNSAL